MDAQPAAESPFIEGTRLQFAWDSTSLGYLKRCPRLYYYRMIEGWGDNETSIHLTFGIEYHQALQDYDVLRVGGASHDDALRQVVRELLIRTADYKDPVYVKGKSTHFKSREGLVRTVIWYLDEHKDDPAEVYIKADGEPAVELSFRFELDWSPMNHDTPYIVCGHLDKIVNFADDLYDMDHKTTTYTPGDYYWKQFNPDNQMSLYALASQIVIDSPVKGVVINAAQLLADSSRFVRGITYRTPDQLEEWLFDLKYWLIVNEGFVNSDYWPQNDTACDKYGGCTFREVCSKSPSVRERFLKSHFTQLPEEERWNPLKPR